MHAFALLRRSAVLVTATMIVFSVAACSDDEEDDAAGGGGDACGQLCTGGGFKGGTAQEFSQVVECQCTGTSSSGGLKKASCESYCAPRGIAAEKSFLSTETTENDKCVCDGTGG